MSNKKITRKHKVLNKAVTNELTSTQQEHQQQELPQQVS
jgi:hypothetical protein